MPCVVLFGCRFGWVVWYCICRLLVFLVGSAAKFVYLFGDLVTGWRLIIAGHTVISLLVWVGLFSLLAGWLISCLRAVV